LYRKDDFEVVAGMQLANSCGQEYLSICEVCRRMFQELTKGNNSTSRVQFLCVTELVQVHELWSFSLLFLPQRVDRVSAYPIPTMG
jgi:hypothetical protein